MATKKLLSIAERMEQAEKSAEVKANEDLTNARVQVPTRKKPIVQVMAKQTKDSTTTICVRIDNKVQKALLTLNNETGQYGVLLNFLIARGMQAVLHDMQRGNTLELFTSFNPKDDSIAGVRDKLLNELITN